MQDREGLAEDVIRLLQTTDDLPPTASEISNTLGKGVGVDIVRKTLAALHRDGLVMPVSPHRNRHRGRTWRLVEPPTGVKG